MKKNKKLLGCSLALTALMAAPPVFAGNLEVISKHLDGTSANGGVVGMSDTGRYVLFSANRESNIDADFPTITNGLYLHDTETGVSKNIHHAPDGSPANAYNSPLYGTLTKNGRFAVFNSGANNLDPNDINTTGHMDIFFYDVETGITEFINKPYDGVPDGGLDDFPAGVTPDGRYVIFNSRATNLVPGDTNGAQDGFLWDRENQVMENITIGYSGNGWPGHGAVVDISENGRYVLFTAIYGSSNMRLFMRDREKGTTQLINAAQAGGYIEMSSDARFVVHRSNSYLDPNYQSGGLFMFDRHTNTHSLLVIPATGEPLPGAIVHDLSDDGRFLYFSSSDSTLVPGDTNTYTDAFVLDREKQTIKMISVTNDGIPGDNYSGSNGYISQDGRYITFSTRAQNLGAAYNSVVRYDTQQGCGL